MNFTASPLERLSETMDIFKTTIGGSSLDLLLQLDRLGLYQKPSNSSTRGGERFIFSSEKLSSALTQALKDMPDTSNHLEMCDDWTRPFVAVNHVFRCNRFAPGDAKFESHMDTPYYDPGKRHMSKFTIIIYLSSGSGSPILRLWNNNDGKDDNNNNHNDTFELTEVKQFDCVIFDQQYRHEGNPFLDTDKVFLRSELIYKYDEYDELKHVPEVGKVFSSAVYMTLQSTFQPDLSRYTHDLYERVNALHWGLKDDLSPPPVVLQKKWRGNFVFATNGCDYWFPYVHESGSVNGTPHDYLKEIGLIAVLDYFNGRSRDMRETSNSNMFTTSKMISDPNNPATQTSDFILSNLWRKVQKLRNVTKNSKSLLLAPIDIKAIQKQYRPGIEKDDTNWHAVLKKGLKDVLKSPLILFNQEYVINKEKIIIENDKIMIGYGFDPLFCNFASASNEYKDAREDLEDIPAPKLLVPPISFVAIPASEDGKIGPGFLLLLDFFKNDWSVPSIKELKHLATILTKEVAEEYYEEEDEDVDEVSEGDKETKTDDAPLIVTTPTQNIAQPDEDEDENQIISSSRSLECITL